MLNFTLMKRFFIALGIGLLIILAVLILKWSGFQSSLQASIAGGGGGLVFLVMIGALLDSINPCAISVLLLSIAFLWNLGHERKRVLLYGGVYIFGIFSAYLLIGLGLLQVFQVLNIPHVLAKFGAGIIIAVGLLEVINHLYPNFPIKAKIPEFTHERMAKLMEKSSYPAFFLLGGLVGVFEFPCTGGPYLLVLGLLHDQRTYLEGVGYLFLYNLIFVLPLIFILILGSNKELMEKVQVFRKTKTRQAKFITGIVMIVLGIIIFLV